MTSSPEIGTSIATSGFLTNVHDVGEGPPVLLIHGSGPGVSAWANWRLVLPNLSRSGRVIAPDMVGFGYTERPHDVVYRQETWLQQLKDLMDELQIPAAHIVGNSFGGALALAFALAHPERVNKLVLMGSVGLSFPITDGLNKVWGYRPGVEAMGELIRLFAYDQSIATPELIALRYKASAPPEISDSFSKMFPEPRQRWVDALALPEAKIASLPHTTLIVHGRDDRIIPVACSERLSQLIPRSQLHVFGQCGHWVQIEKAKSFNRLLEDFFFGGYYE